MPQELRESDEGAFTEVATTVAEPMAAEAAAQAAGKAWEKVEKMAIFMAFEAFFHGFLGNFRDFSRVFQRFYPVKHRMNLLGHVNLKGQTRSLEVNQPAKMWGKKWVVKMD